MNILVTGASGFVGRQLCARLIARGHQVFGLSSHKPSEICPGLAGYFVEDISRPFKIIGRFDFVFHLAAYNITHVGVKDADMYTRINVKGTEHVAAAVDCNRFIFLSTAKVYKNQGLPVTEESSLAPVNAYEVSKLKAEEACASLLPKDHLIIFRSVNIFGPGQATKAVLPVFFEKAKKGLPVDILVPAKTMIQFIDIEDIIDAFESVIAHPAVNGIFNIANSKAITVEELARKIITITCSPSSINVLNVNEALAFMPVQCLKAFTLLGWKAKTDLETTLKRYNEYFA